LTEMLAVILRMSVIHRGGSRRIYGKHLNFAVIIPNEVRVAKCIA
jgi:hypothetical protein